MGRDKGGRRDLQRAEGRIRRVLRLVRAPALFSAGELLWIAAHCAPELEALLDPRFAALGNEEQEARVHAVAVAAARTVDGPGGDAFCAEVVARLEHEADPFAADLAQALAGPEAAQVGGLVFLRTFTQPLVTDPRERNEVHVLGDRTRWRPSDLAAYAALLHRRGDRAGAARVGAAIAALPRRGIPALWRRITEARDAAPAGAEQLALSRAPSSGRQ